MADKTVENVTLKLLAKFADGDTRTISFDDPNTSLNLGQAVYSLGSFCVENQIIIGDKTGAAFTNFDYAHVVTRAETYLDLG